LDYKIILFIKQKIFELAVEENCFFIVSYLLKNKKIKLKNHSFRLSALRGHFNIVKLLLNDNRLDPTDVDNLPIYLAHRNDHNKVVDLLFSNLLVKNKIKKEDSEMYDIFMKQRAQNIIEDF
jgi:hypothetical protein